MASLTDQLATGASELTNKTILVDDSFPKSATADIPVKAFLAKKVYSWMDEGKESSPYFQVSIIFIELSFRLALGRAHTHEPTLSQIRAPIDSETAIVVNGSKSREREVSDAKGNSNTKASVVITYIELDIQKAQRQKEKQKQRRCLPHWPLTIYPRRLSLCQRDSFFLEQARRYQDKILAEAEKEEEKEKRTATIKSLDELQLCPFVNEGIERPAKGSTSEFQDYETKSWD
ncbi:hypothetical protein Tco_0770918 [Tanacetum coccineum]|uniref:Uncharacterized protein n=1 Tax=Tanacetum coccineum TaxID=301880 RepID=A0ABQ4ZGF4_9ASTR